MSIPELFDTHCHLDFKDFVEDQDGYVRRAAEAGVTRLVTIGASDKFDSAERAILLSERFPNVWASVGIHPHCAAIPIDISRLRELAEHSRVVAIGETGLDFFRDWAPRKDQEEWFRAQITLAKELNKPLIIHSREAGADCLAILKETKASEVGGVFHCYAENAEFAKELEKINFIVSVPGILTFKNAKTLQEAMLKIPLEQIMIETDAPFLAPVPFRGKTCESYHVVETAKALAEIKSLSFEEVAKTTTETAKRFYRVD